MEIRSPEVDILTSWVIPRTDPEIRIKSLFLNPDLGFTRIILNSSLGKVRYLYTERDEP
jgi:hypothetical protein